MRYIVGFLTIFLLSYAINGKAENKTKTFKSKKYGFEFSYPENWEVESAIGGLEPDEEVPIDEDSALLILDRQKYINNKCSRNCQVYVYIYGDKHTQNEYEELIEDLNRRYKYPKGKKVKVAESLLNNYNTTYLAQIINSSDGNIGTQALIYCPDSYTVISLTNIINLKNKGGVDYQNIELLPLNLETLFYSEQIPIIKSIKCPPKDFVYKKTEKIKSKKQ